MVAPHSDVVPEHWVVLLKPFASAEIKDAHLSSIQSMTQDSRTPFSCKTHHEFNLPECRGYSGKFNLQTKENIEQMDGVLSIEPVRYLRHCQRAVQKNSTWGLDRISHPKTVKPNGPYEYKYPSETAGQDTTAYIIDTGINKDHEEFEGRASRAPNFVTPSSAAGVDDVQGHGTHVAGTIGGKSYGVAKKVNLVSVKVFPDDEDAGARTDDIIKALEWVKEDASGKKAVVNMSLGGPKLLALNAAVAAVVRSGVLVCVAAGNESEPADKGSPASEPLAITVGATDKSDQIAEWSDYGRFVDVFGPGVDITSAWKGSKDATETISGTSMATPHVTGLVCCLLSNQKLEDYDPYGVTSKIFFNADKNKIQGLDTITSNTLIQVV